MKKANEKNNKIELENKTLNFIKSLKETSEKEKTNFSKRNKKALDSPKNIKISMTELKEDLNILESSKVEKITINPMDDQNQHVTLKLNSAYVNNKIGSIYGVDINKVKSSLDDSYKMMAFNSIVRLNLKENKDIFLKGL